MQSKVIILFALLLLVFTFSFVSAELSIDIKLDKQSYSPGENIKYSVLLYDNGAQVSEQIAVKFSDILSKNQITKTIKSNTENLFQIEDNFTNGDWNIEAQYLDRKVKRTFSVKGQQQVKFEIQDDILLITNKGNIPYAREIYITIGEEKTSSQKIYLNVGGKKELRLVGKDKNYNIKITDGENTITKQNVYLTGNIIGAVDPTITDGSILGGPRDPDEEGGLFSSDKIPIAFIFVGAIFGLGILLLIERTIRKKK